MCALSFTNDVNFIIFLRHTVYKQSIMRFKYDDFMYEEEHLAGHQSLASLRAFDWPLVKFSLSDWLISRTAGILLRCKSRVKAENNCKTHIGCPLEAGVSRHHGGKIKYPLMLGCLRGFWGALGLSPIDPESGKSLEQLYARLLLFFKSWPIIRPLHMAPVFIQLYWK